MLTMQLTSYSFIVAIIVSVICTIISKIKKKPNIARFSAVAFLGSMFIDDGFFYLLLIFEGSFSDIFLFDTVPYIAIMLRAIACVLLLILVILKKRNFLSVIAVSTITISYFVVCISIFVTEGFYNLSSLIFDLLFYSVWILFVFIIGCAVSKNEKANNTAKKLYMLPAILFSIILVGGNIIQRIIPILSNAFDAKTRLWGVLEGIFNGWWSIVDFPHVVYSYLIPALLPILVTLFVGKWFAYPEGKPRKMKTVVSSPGTPTVYKDNTEGYIGMGIHILLLLVTFGIWNYIWIYRTTKFLNRVEGVEYRNPTTKLLLSMFVPFYSIYWTYKSAQYIDKLARSKGIQSDISTICLILEFFVPIVPPILMQDKINSSVLSVESKTQYSVNNTPTETAVMSDDLKKLKELLDNGILTQEEFDAKKKQILDL